VLVEFKGVRDMVCFKENKILCSEAPPDNLYQLQPKCQEGGIELETRANTTKRNWGMKATKIPIGTCARWVGLSFPDGESYSETSTSMGRSCGLRRSTTLFRKAVRRLDIGETNGR